MPRKRPAPQPETPDGTPAVEGAELAFPATVEASGEFRRSYGEYSLYVIKHRALPDVRDGLKPVHRRILHAMNELGVTPSKPFRKSAWTVGEVIGKFHPHGDAAVYDTMARMAQDFSLRYPLVEGEGNFGSMDGDSPAAPRYTEARMASTAMSLLADIGDGTVDWVKNYDESRDEPVVLPGRFPNLLVNGSSGIAVGMVTNMPPHNLREVVKGLCLLLDNPKATTADLMKHVKGPDFPTYGIVLGKEGLKEAYETGEGKVTVRARLHLEEDRGKTSIVITEIPYQTSRKKIVMRIAGLTQQKTELGNYLAGTIADAQDHTDRNTPPLRTRIVVDLKRDANPAKVIGLLLKHTPLQQTFGIKNLCLVPDAYGALVPRMLGLKEMMEHYVAFQLSIIRRRTQHKLDQVLKDLHILDGYLVAFQDIDKVIAVIKPAQGRADAVARLMKAFRVSEAQANAIAMLRLHQISKIDIGDFRRQHDEKKAVEKDLRGILKSEARQKAIIKEDLERIAAEFGDARRTAIETADAAAEGNYEAVAVAEASGERTLIVGTAGGYVKRIPATLRSGGKAVSLDSGDEATVLVPASTLDEAWFLTGNANANFVAAGSVFPLDRQDRGKPLANLVGGGGDLNLRAVVAVPRALRGDAGRFLVTSSREGLVKRTGLDSYVTNRTSIQGFVERGEDRVAGAAVCGEADMLLATTDDGMTVHFPLVGNPEKPSVPLQGRASAGVGAVKLAPGAAMLPVATYTGAAKDVLLLVVTERGFGRLIAAGEFPVTNRNVKGVRTVPLDAAKQGKVAATLAMPKSARKDAAVLLLLASGSIVKVKAKDIPVGGRTTRLAAFVEVPTGDRITAAVLEG